MHRSNYPNIMVLIATWPSRESVSRCNEYKRCRAERGLSAWTIKGDLSTLKAIFGKWLVQECGLLTANPFANVRPPKCDEPDVRIVTADESADLFAWLGERWNGWRLPIVYLEVLALVGWRATETASLRVDGLLAGGFVKVQAESSKTRKHKHSRLPADLFADVQACSAGGWAFGRFSDELRRLMLLWKRRPHHAALIKDFTPKRFVGWVQDELQRFSDEQTKAAAAADPPRQWEPFTLHDFRKTAITGMQMAGVSENEASIQTGVTPETIRRHYERLNQMEIAGRILERRLGAAARPAIRYVETENCSRPVRAGG
jgi:integrase